MRRVVITGAGTVNALGLDVESTLVAMRAGRSAIGPVTFRDADKLSVKIGAQVHDWDPQAHLGAAKLPLYDRFTQFALKATSEALAQSGLSFEGDLALQAGVIIGTAGGGHQTQEDSYRDVFQAGKTRVHPFTVPKLMPSAAASHVSMVHGLMGPVLSVSSACASSNHAIALAVQMIRGGAAKVMLSGGAESMLSFGGLKAWEGLRVMSPTGCRPFSKDRDGMVQGEGAGVFVLEDREHAIKRGAVILAEVAGVYMGADAGDIVMPLVDGAVRAMKGALADAGLRPDQIGYLNAHGTGTLANDRTEAAAIRQVFTTPPPVSSTKAMHGHCIGATGAIELLACLMALNEGVLAPTVNFTTPDPACALDVIPNRARKAQVEAVLSNAFAFGGLNAVLALTKG